MREPGWLQWLKGYRDVPGASRASIRRYMGEGFYRHIDEDVHIYVYIYMYVYTHLFLCIDTKYML